MAKGLHGEPPEEQSSSVINILLLFALIVVVASIIGMADGFRNLLEFLPWARRW